MLEQWSYGHADHDPQSISWLVWGRSGISGHLWTVASRPTCGTARQKSLALNRAGMPDPPSRRQSATSPRPRLSVSERLPSFPEGANASGRPTAQAGWSVAFSSTIFEGQTDNGIALQCPTRLLPRICSRETRTKLSGAAERSVLR